MHNTYIVSIITTPFEPKSSFFKGVQTLAIIIVSKRQTCPDSYLKN